MSTGCFDRLFFEQIQRSRGLLELLDAAVDLCTILYKESRNHQGSDRVYGI